MNLEKWVEYGWLRQEPTSPTEIKSLLSIVQRGINDAKVKAISADLRFIAAFSAALTVATTAPRASGFRIPTSPGHHAGTIDSLELTMNTESKVVQKMKVFSNKCNKSSYDVAGGVSDQEVDSMLILTGELADELADWLQKNHPELLGP